MTVHATRPTVAAMREHLHDLADAYGATIEEGWTDPHAAARLIYNVTDPDARARVLMGTLRDRRVYIDGLHEFGHLHAWRHGEMTHNPYDRDGRVLYDEAYAWAWAFGNARWEPTPTLRRHAADVLYTCAQDLGADWDDPYGRGMVEAWGLANEYDALLAVVLDGVA